MGHQTSKRRFAGAFREGSDANSAAFDVAPGRVDAGHSDQNAVCAGAASDVSALSTPAGIAGAEGAVGGAAFGEVLAVALDGGARIPAEKSGSGGDLEAVRGVGGGIVEGEGVARTARAGSGGLPAARRRAEAARAAEGGGLAGGFGPRTRGSGGKGRVGRALRGTERGRIGV